MTLVEILQTQLKLMNINEETSDFTQNTHNFYSNVKVIDTCEQQMITMYIGHLQKHLLSQVIIYQITVF